jgi:hypothetical protein
MTKQCICFHAIARVKLGRKIRGKSAKQVINIWPKDNSTCGVAPPSRHGFNQDRENEQDNSTQGNKKKGVFSFPHHRS